MNKTEKIICILLGAVLAWYLFIEMPKQSQAAADAAKAASDPENRDGIAAAARALIDYRIANRDAMMDHYEQVMNSRTKGTEGHRECAAEPCQGGVQKVICNSFAMRSWSFRSDV